MAIRTIRELVLRLRDVGIAEAEKNVTSLGKATVGLTDRWAGVGPAITKAAQLSALAIGTVTAAATGAGLAVLNTGRNLDTYRQRLTGVLGDAERARDRMDALLAMPSPFDLSDLVNANAQLELFGINAEAVLADVGNAAAALGKNVSEGADALTQAMAGNLRGLKEFGVTASEIEKQLGFMPDSSTVSGQRQIVDAVLEIWTKRFPEGMKQAGETVNGILGQMNDNMTKFRAKIVQGGMFDTLKADLREVSGLVDRFVSEGGADAFAVGFNAAFQEIHRVFFEPFFGGLDEIPIRVAVIAARTEKIILETAATIDDVIMHLRIGASGLAGTGELMKSAFKFDKAGVDKWTTYLNETLPRAAMEAQMRVAGMRGRVSELDEALQELARNGGKVTPEIQQMLGYTGDAWSKLMNTFVGPIKPPEIDTNTFRESVKKTKEEMDAELEKIVPQFAIRPELFTLQGGLMKNALAAGEATGAEFGRGLKFGVEREANTGIGIDPANAQQQLKQVQGIYADHLGTLGGMDAQYQEQIVSAEAALKEAKQQFLGDDVARIAEYYDGLGDMSAMSVEERLTHEATYLNEQIQMFAASQAAAQEMFSNLGVYAQHYANKSLNIGRVTNALLIRGAGEYTKAVIAALTQEAKVKSAMELAASIAAAATFNFPAAAKHALAAAKYGLVAGIGGVASALVDREVSEREQVLMGQDADMFGEGRSRERFKTSSSVRQGPVVNNFYISIDHHIQGDYIVQDEKSDVQMIQELLDSNLVVTRIG